jgi:PadR family transcriptional regulator PadR
MRRLQNDGLVATYLVESPAGPPRKYYRLTDAGKASLGSQKAAWTAFAQAMRTMRSPPPWATPAGSRGSCAPRSD